MTSLGKCYEVTFHTMLNDKMLEKEGRIVHGQAVDPKSGKRIDHAWIEFGTMVIDPTISDGMIRKTRYYEVLQAKPKKRYTMTQAINQAFKLKKGFSKW